MIIPDRPPASRRCCSLSVRSASGCSEPFSRMARPLSTDRPNEPEAIRSSARNGLELGADVGDQRDLDHFGRKFAARVRLAGLLAFQHAFGADLAAQPPECGFDSRPLRAHEFTGSSTVHDYLSFRASAFCCSIVPVTPLPRDYCPSEVTSGWSRLSAIEATKPPIRAGHRSRICSVAAVPSP